MLSRKELIKKKGEVQIGQKAYIDGRDFWSFPKLTIMRVNAYKDCHRSKRVRKLNHGSLVSIKEYKPNSKGGKFGIFLVTMKRKSFWVSELFLSNEFPTIIGSKYMEGRLYE